MGSYVVKRAPDVDEYVEWSTVVDGPTTPPLNRAAMLDWLVETSRLKPEYARPEAEERLDRADRIGTSSHHRHHGWWGDGTWIIEDGRCAGITTDREGAFAFAVANVRWEDDDA